MNIFSNKKGVQQLGSQTWTILAVFGVAILLISYFSGALSGLGLTSPAQQTVVQTAVSEATVASLESSAACPNGKTTTLTVNVMNAANGTASEEIPGNAFLFRVKDDGSLEQDAFTTIASTRDGTATLNCGETYTMKLRTTSTATQAAGNGLNSTRIDAATGIDGLTFTDEEVTFEASGSAQTLTVNSNKHGVLEFQTFSNPDNGFLNEAGATASTAYQASPADFESTTDTTALAVGAGGELDLTINFRTQDVDKEYNNLGYFISVNASTTVFDVPTLTLDGEELSNVKGSLDQYCSRAYSNEEYVYFADRDVPVNSKGQLDFYMKALSGVNPAATDDPSITWHAIGTYVSITGSNNLQVGACDDGSSTQNVYAAERVSIDIS